MAMAAADAELELDLFGPTTMLEAFDQVVVHRWVRFRVLFPLSTLFATPAIRSQRLIDGTSPFGNGWAPPL